MAAQNQHDSQTQIARNLGDARATLDPKLVDGDVLLTGFPGYVAKNLLKRLIELQPEAKFHLLIQARLRGLAEASLAELERDHPGFQGRWELVEGDITVDSLGLSPEEYKTLSQTITSVWHLAAIYDLAVPEQAAYQVNVGGTIRMLDFCEDCAQLARFNYISTCYVSGQREGLIYEDELDEGQGHRNHYESTKFWAEVEVRRRASLVPTVILRPGIIVGDSRTGETDKYDGPYFLMKLVKRLPDWLPMLNVGKGDALVNLVPIDFAADAMAYLGLKAGMRDKTFHIADPNPMRARDVIASTLSAMGRAPAIASLPPGLVDAALKRHSIESLVGVPRETLAYFNHDARYDSRHTQSELSETRIRCPHLSTYMQTLVDYFLRNPDKTFLDRRRANQQAEA